MNEGVEEKSGGTPTTTKKEEPNEIIVKQEAAATVVDIVSTETAAATVASAGTAATTAAAVPAATTAIAGGGTAATTTIAGGGTVATAVVAAEPATTAIAAVKQDSDFALYETLYKNWRAKSRDAVYWGIYHSRGTTEDGADQIVCAICNSLDDKTPETFDYKKKGHFIYKSSMGNNSIRRHAEKTDNEHWKIVQHLHQFAEKNVLCKRRRKSDVADVDKTTDAPSPSPGKKRNRSTNPEKKQAPPYSPTCPQQKRFDQQLCSLFGRSKIPPSLVDDTYFRSLIHSIDPRLSIPSRTQLCSTLLPASTIPNPLGVHALVFTGGWSHRQCIEAVSSASRAGYQIIEIPALDPSLIDIQHTKSVLQSYDMKATVSLGLSFDADINHEDPEVVRRGLQKLMDALEVTEQIGSDYLGGVLYSALGKYSKPPTATARTNAIASLKKLAVAARAKGVTVGLEPVNRYESNLINTAQQALDAIQEIDEENVVVHLDVYHMNIEEEDMTSPVLLCGAKLGYVHIGASHRGPLGRGNIDYDAFFKALKKIDYEGIITFESFSSEVVHPSLSSSLAIWRNLWGDGQRLAKEAREFMLDKIVKARASLASE